MDYLEYVDQRVAELERLIEKKKKALSKAPTGYLRICGSQKKPQYYHRKTASDKQGQYIQKKNMVFAQALAQKEYDERVLKVALKELMTLKKLLTKQVFCDVEKIYDDLSAYRKYLVRPDFMSDEEYIQKWQDQKYEGKFVDAQTEYYTRRGEKVRSKSEILIADLLDRMSIPYHYEMPLELSGIVIHPDFTVLNVKKRKTIYLEHLGMMDDPEYCQMAMEKILLYEKNRIFPGDKLMITHETQRRPLNLRLLEKMVRFYLM